MKSMKKCIVTKEKISKSIKLDKRRSNKRRSSAGMFYTSSAGAVTSLICFGNQKMLSRTRVAPARRHGRSALILGRNLRNVLYSIFLITLPVLLVHQAHATASTINISVVDSVSLNILPNGTTGTFVSSDTSTNNISVRTTNGTGYTLGIKASTEGSNALNGANSTSIPSHTVSAGISEATYSTDSTYNNTWGYRPSKLNSTANSNYLPGPSSASSLTILDQTSSANSNANNYNLAIGARINSSTTPGAYGNTFVITVTANPVNYSITYNTNATGVSDMPPNVSNQPTDTEQVNISSTVPTRDGYDFKGWCTIQTSDGDDATACTTAGGTAYNPDGGGTDLAWTINQTQASNSLSLYAMWATEGVIDMQDATFADCGKTMRDSRDDETYSTAVLADGNCWMLDNLRLDPTLLTQGQLYGSDTHRLTDASNATLGYLKNGGGSSPYTNYAVSRSTSSTGYYDRPIVTVSGTCYNNFCVNDPSSGRWTSSSMIPAEISGVISIAQGEVGVYYNFCAVSAGSYCYASSKSSGNAKESLCPFGWRLPTGNNGGEYQMLYDAYGGDVVEFETALNTPLSGFYNEGSARYQGSEGFFWSSTRCNRNDRMCYLNVSSNNVDAVSGFNRSRGYSIRCLKTP